MQAVLASFTQGTTSLEASKQRLADLKFQGQSTLQVGSARLLDCTCRLVIHLAEPIDALGFPSQYVSFGQQLHLICMFRSNINVAWPQSRVSLEVSPSLSFDSLFNTGDETHHLIPLLSAHPIGCAYKQGATKQLQELIEAGRAGGDVCSQSWGLCQSGVNGRRGGNGDARHCFRNCKNEKCLNQD